MTNFKLLGSSLTIALVSASAAIAAPPPEYNGTTATGTSSVVAGTSTTVTTGDATCTSSANCTNTTTTTQNQAATTTTAATTTAISTLVPGGTSTPYAGTLTVSGSGAQNQTVASSLTTHFNPGTPPTFAFNDAPVTGAPVTVGTPTVTAVSASGSAGFMSTSTGGSGAMYGSTLSTSGPVTAGTVVATENSTLISSSGTTYEQRVGSATYNSGTGAVTVALPSAATSSTFVNALGLTTTGSVTATTLTGTTVNGGTVNGGVFNANVGGVAGAAGINAGGGRITGLANGTGLTDAVNLSQLNAVSGSVTTLASLVAANQKRSDGGIATAVALSGGTFLPNKKINLTVNVGGYRNEAAVAAQLGVLISENIALNAGIATGLHSYSGTSYRAGLTFGF